MDSRLFLLQLETLSMRLPNSLNHVQCLSVLFSIALLILIGIYAFRIGCQLVSGDKFFSLEESETCYLSS